MQQTIVWMPVLAQMSQQPVALLVFFSVPFLAVLVGLVLAMLLLTNLPLYLRMRRAGLPVAMLQVVALRVRQDHPGIVVDSNIRLWQAGLDIRLEQLEAHALCGGRVDRVAEAMAAAQAWNIPLDWKTACDIDLCERDVLGELTEHARRLGKPMQSAAKMNQGRFGHEGVAQ